MALITGLALASTQIFLGPAAAGTLKTCPADSPLSCHNTTAVADLCCFNAPGGQLLQTQFWDTDPATGPADSWTIHGLWPDHCDGTFDQYCDESRQYTNITQILQSFGATDLLDYMNTYWKNQDGTDESFWEHEAGKHFTCISTLDPSCYTSYTPTQEVPDIFNRTVSLFQTLPTYQWLSDAGITPSSSQNYSLADVQSALAAQHGANVTLECTDDGQLDEVYYHFNVKGNVQDGEFVPAAPDGEKTDCPDSLLYLPKSVS